MASVLSPGVLYLAKAGVQAVFAIAVLISLRHLTSAYISWTTITLGSILSVPLLIAIYDYYRRWSIRNRAWAMGARLPPAINGRWPGNLDVLLDQVKQHKYGYPGDGQRDLLHELGPIISMDLLGEHLTFTTEPNHVKAILATDFGHFEKGSKIRAAFTEFLGTGVFNSDGETWKYHRTMTRPFFSRERVSDFDTFDKHTDDLIRRLKTRTAEGIAVDFQDAIGRFTMDTASEFLFGKSVDSLAAGLPYPETHPAYAPRHHNPDHPSEAYVSAFNDVQIRVALRARIGILWPLTEMRRSAISAPMKVVRSFLQPLLDASFDKISREKTADQKATSPEDENLLDYLVRLSDDRELVEYEVLNLMLAGKETVQSTLAFVVYFLSQYPEKLCKLRVEILEKLGRNRKPSFDDIREMKYLRAVINETLRLYPVVPFNARASTEDVLLPPLPESEDQRPYFIPAGTRVRWSVLLMQRRTDLWGPDAEEFDPERWLDDRVKDYVTKNPFIFLPFNAGPRICLGQQFAYNEMSFALIVLLQNFSNFELDLSAQPAGTGPPSHWAQSPGRKGVEKFNPKSHLTAYAQGGLWLYLKPASE